MPGRAELRCGTPPFDSQPDLAALHGALTTAIARFPDLTRTLAKAPALCLDDRLFGAQGYFEPDSGRIVLSARLPRGLALAVAVHELRHMQQFDDGHCPTLALSMEAYAEFVFAMEADASVTSLAVAYLQRGTGEPAMWEALASWPMQADLAVIFETTLAETGDMNRTAAATFAAWYDRPARREAYYIASCLEYLDQLDQQHLLPRYGALPDDLYAKTCRLPDGRPYDCVAPKTEGHEPVNR